MTTIERIGHFTIAQHGPAYLLLDHTTRDHETFTTARAARETALERVDVLTFYEHTAALCALTHRRGH
jgi:hypothetical protein